VEAWIEMLNKIGTALRHAVASFVEAWIEIPSYPYISSNVNVASFVEAWIEIVWDNEKKLWVNSRFLRGSVD